MISFLQRFSKGIASVIGVIGGVPISVVVNYALVHNAKWYAADDMVMTGAVHLIVTGFITGLVTVLAPPNSLTTPVSAQSAQPRSQPPPGTP